MRLFPQETDIRSLSPITLAFVGDGAYELMVREYLATTANRPTGELHRRAVSMVCAPAQAAAFKKIEPLLTEEELAVYKRGRNAHTVRSGQDYHCATGFETLWGWLYLQGEIARLQTLFSVILGDQLPITPDKEEG